MEWQPIETAPKGHPHKSEMVLLLSYNHPDDYDASIAVGFWSTIDALGEDERLGWCNWNAGFDESEMWEEIVNPTHWMPLPTPPEDNP